MSEELKSLLPANATKQEIDIEMTNAGISEIPVKAIDLWNPDKCPAEFLPWLAYSVAISEWDDTWTDTQKRQAIKDSYFVHQKRGTIGAMRKALANLGANIRVIEWFESGKAPYTFAIQVGIFGNDDPEVIKKILRVVDRTKNERSHLTGIDIITKTEGVLCLLVAACISSFITIYPKEDSYYGE